MPVRLPSNALLKAKPCTARQGVQRCLSARPCATMPPAPSSRVQARRPLLPTAACAKSNGFSSLAPTCVASVDHDEAVPGWWPQSVNSVDLRDGRLSIYFKSGERFMPHLFYLRDQCGCKLCRHEITHQRLVDTFELPANPAIARIESSEAGVSITWRQGQHQSFYSWRWLALHANQSTQGGEVLDIEGKKQSVTTWDSSISAHPPSVGYDWVMQTEEGVRIWTKLIREFGFCFVDGCPPTPGATEKLLQRISLIRYTHYGGFWEVESSRPTKDTVHTSAALDAHTDTAYFSDPVGLESFHVISHTDGAGGKSLLVDGWRAAAVLRIQSPEDYETLKRQPIRWQASGNQKTYLNATGPVLANHVPHDGDPLSPTTVPGPIRWNNSDRANAVGIEHCAYTTWLAAARRWDAIIKDPQLQYWEQLQPGRVLILDNQRVLHGRSAFTGKRRLCGGYTNMDDFISRWRTLNFKRDVLLDHQA